MFFRLGDFYETFDDDAKVVAPVCNIVLTGRDMGGDALPVALADLVGVDIHHQGEQGDDVPLLFHNFPYFQRLGLPFDVEIGQPANRIARLDPIMDTLRDRYSPVMPDDRRSHDLFAQHVPLRQ